MIDPASHVPTGIGAVAYLDRLQKHFGLDNHRQTCDKMIVLQKDGNTTAPMFDFDEAQKMVNDGWEVFINKTGNKLIKKTTPKRFFKILK